MTKDEGRENYHARMIGPSSARSAAKPQPSRRADILVPSRKERKERGRNFQRPGGFGRCCGQECPRAGAVGKILAESKHVGPSQGGGDIRHSSFGFFRHS